MAKIIICDDDELVRTTFRGVLEREGHRVVETSTRAQLMDVAETEAAEVVLLDIHLPDGRGEEMIPPLLEEDSLLRVIVITGDSSLETAVTATKKGAYDYLTKPFTRDTLLHVVKQALDSRNNEVGATASQRTALPYEGPVKRLMGSSPDIAAVNLLIERVSKTPSTPVLIVGESGTGKEVTAEAIHNNSARRNGPLIKVNCAAIPAPLVEGELFGHMRGSFTDAREARAGLFELADGGTIFLDEIGELDIAVQPKLLRILETQEVMRLGSGKPKRVDIRVIAATNRDLERACKESKFREDLYFRLAVMQIQLPPLRRHPEDIPMLASMFLQQKCAELSKRIHGFSPEIEKFFRQYPWPGNVRELKNMVERLIILADSNVIELSEELLAKYCFNWTPERPLSATGSTSTGAGAYRYMESGSPTGSASRSRPASQTGSSETSGSEDDLSMTARFSDIPRGQFKTLDEMEKSYMKTVLEGLNFNKTRVARTLGISRSTLRRKIAFHGLEDWVDTNSS